MKPRIYWLIGIFLGVLTTAAADAKPQDLPGLKAGAAAPGFELTDQEGKARTLKEFTAKGPVALVFFRSADW